MAYTIKGLAKANGNYDEDFSPECNLASVWVYWLDCNCCDKQSIRDFLSLRKKDRVQMLVWLKENYEISTWDRLLNHLLPHIYD